MRYPKKREYAHTKDGTVIMETALITGFWKNLKVYSKKKDDIKSKLALRKKTELQCVRKLRSLRPMFKN